MANSNSNQTQPAGNPIAKALDLALSAALIAGVGYYAYSVVSHGVKIDQGANTLLDTSLSDSETPTEPPVIFGTEEIPNSEVHNGALVLVNNFTPLDEKYNNDGLVSLYIASMEAEANHSFGTIDAALSLKEETAAAAIAMLDAFYQATYDNSIVVKGGFRTTEEQQALYENNSEDEDENDSSVHRAAMPGFSEHQTGLCLDLGLNGDEYDGTGNFTWLTEHCAEFGMILRYPEDKFDRTNMAYEPWHFRYVGKPHASVMMNQNMCLEEYIDFVKEYTYDGEHLRVADSDGQVYEIYYYPEDTAHESTLVPVPGAGVSYTVCGNNVDGFIVTIATGETDAAPAAPEGEENADPENADPENGDAEQADPGNDDPDTPPAPADEDDDAE